MGMGETKKNCTIYWIEIYLAPVVQNVDNTIYRINVYPLNSAILIHWIVVYPVDSGIQLLKNWAKVDSTIQPWNNRGKCVRNSRKLEGCFLSAQDVCLHSAYCHMATLVLAMHNSSHLALKLHRSPLFAGFVEEKS